MAEVAQHLTFWQFTIENARDAVSLYFAPLRRIAWLFGHEPIDVRSILQEHEELKNRVEYLERHGPSLHVLEDFQLRVARIKTLDNLPPDAQSALGKVDGLFALAELLLRQSGHQAELSEVLNKLENEVKRMEVDLGLLKYLKTHGASGD